MHILLHLTAFVLVLVWAFGIFFLHGPSVYYLALLFAAIAFIVALMKRPGKREI